MRKVASMSRVAVVFFAGLGLLTGCGPDADPKQNSGQNSTGGGQAGGKPQDGEFRITPTGLEYRILRKGDGKTRATMMDSVTVNYRGWLDDGSEFDKSSAAVSFQLTNVIRGWGEGLRLVTKGAKVELRVPAALGYGSNPRPKIPPNSRLNFAIELLDVGKRQAPRGLPVYEIPADGEMKTDPSGIEYCIYKPGTGTKHPRVEDKVHAKFTWWTAKGVTIRSTRGFKSLPAMPVGQPTEGWTRALQMMTEGSHYKFKIPGKYGYGDVRPTQVPEGSDLIMEIELVRILDGPKFYLPKNSELKRTAGGTQYAVIRGGNPNKLPGSQSFYTLRYASWTTEGKFVESTFTHGNTLAGKQGDFSIPFLNEIPAIMGEGALWVVIVDPATQFPRTPRPREEYNKTSLWQLEMIKVTPSPVFVKPDPSKFRRSPSGLQYEAVKTVAGKGQRVAPSQTAVTIMTAWLPSGQIVDTSVATPTGHRVWRLSSTAAGYREALQMMKVGETYRFIVPQALRQGERKNPRVPTGSDLILSIQLVGVK